MTTSAQRRAIREAGPYSTGKNGLIYAGLPEDSVFLDYTPETTKEAAVAALNAIAQEPEAVAKAREKVMRLAVIAGKATRWDDSLTNLNVACVAYVKAIRDAKRKKKP